MDFTLFKHAVAQQFERMKKHDLFRTGVEKDAMWATYIGSFPAGTNPIYRERTEHDCQCCKQFIRAVGNVVAIIDGKIVSIWDTEVGDPAYQVVADALAAAVKAQPITDVFLHFEPTAGTDKNFQQLVDGQIAWKHFFINIPSKYVKKGADIASALAGPRDKHAVMLRGLTEITDDAVATVLELIGQNSLYRGEEHKHAVSAFQALQRQFRTSDAPSLFVWENVSKVIPSVACIRNTSIGTLLVDLSEGIELEQAVKKFEAMVAPTNYKRPTALVTQGMIDKAKATVEALGLTSALDRRFATLRDINVNNILFADRTAKKSMAGGAFDDLKATAAAQPKLSKVEDVPIEKFVKDILPNIDSIEVMLENRHAQNFVSLIAPADPTANPIFKWPNGFSWSYNGEVADSIKERVKAAGGSVVGDLCCRLAWNNPDDLDFHMVEPNGYRIYYGVRGRRSPLGGMLDVDANGADGPRANPVENIFYASKRTMTPGVYELSVHQFRVRNTADVGFEVEVDVGGTVLHMVYDKAVRQDQRVPVATITYTKQGTFEVKPHLPSTQSSKVVWGVQTQQFHRAAVVMASPNHWDEHAVGNKHWFFMLDGAKNDGKARGFYNEFLRSDLDQHRKVLELVGSKTTVKDDPAQLSGLGFSSTQHTNLLCRVKGSFNRDINIIF